MKVSHYGNTNAKHKFKKAIAVIKLHTNPDFVYSKLDKVDCSSKWAINILSPLNTAFRWLRFSLNKRMYSSTICNLDHDRS